MQGMHVPCEMQGYNTACKSTVASTSKTSWYNNAVLVAAATPAQEARAGPKAEDAGVEGVVLVVVVVGVWPR